MGGQQSGPMNEELKNSKTPGFTGIYRKKGLQTLVITPDPNVLTVGDAIKNSVKLYGNERALGQVVVKHEKDAQGKDIEVRSVNEYTYNEVYNMSMNLGKALIKRKLAFIEPIYKMPLIGIYSKNRYEWIVTDWALVNFNITSVPLYDTLGVQNLTYCLNQTELTTLFSNPATIKVILSLKDHGKLKTLISYDKVDEELQKQIKNANLQLLYYDELIKEGNDIQDINNKGIKIKQDDCYTFSYTSGTTGPPKGAMLSHRNAIAFVGGLHFQSDLKFTHTDIYISYLPLPHVMERTVAVTMMYEGAFFVVASGNTLKLKDDCQVVKPTILLSVPRIYNRIVQGVKSKFAAETGFKKWLIDCGVENKLTNAHQNGGYSNIFYDKVIFSKVRQGFGGNVRIMASGSAPLNPEVHAYMKAIMCCPLVEGYGQTQSTAGLIMSKGDDRNYGVLAQISVGAELKLCDIPEMKYTSEDKDEQGRPSPRGQIWARGPQIFLGYYKQQDVTKDTITPDLWLKTGDIGQIMPDTLSFKIIDRKKNLFKLSQGEYIAPDKVENIYLKNNMVSQIFVHGESMYSFAIVVITPNKDELMKLTALKNIEGTFQEVCKNKNIKILFLTELNNLGKKEGLHGFQQAKNIYLDAQGFGPKNILTNTMKLMRFQARKYYKPIIDELYKEGELSLK